MQNLFEDLKKLLSQDNRFMVEGSLLKNKVVELALQVDAGLMKILLSNESMKKHFFQDVEGVFVFDKIKFQKFVSNKSFLPDSYTSYKNKIGLTVDEDFISETKEVVLSWPYKDCVLEGGQTKDDAKRNEIFWNETLAPDQIDRLLSPKALTNFKKFDKVGEHKVTDISKSENLIIKGNNLLSLVSLKKAYANKIKLIYIDPPYNTPGDANTFLYNNTFNHSTWLSFMKTRLEVSKALLKNDGLIAIAIDDVEYAHLKVLCDEIFSRENYMGTLVVQIKPSGRTTDAYFATSHEYVLFYSKIPNQPEINFFELSKEQKSKYKEGDGENLHKWRDFLRTGGYSTPEERPNSFYPIYYNPKTEDISLEKKGDDYVEVLPLDSNAVKRVWRKTPKSFLTHLENGEIQIVKRSNDTYKVQLIDRIKEGMRPKSVWVDSKYDASSHGTKLLKNQFDGEKVFSFPKSIYAVKDVIEIFTERGGDDIVLDFFAGSGTTAHAVLDLNKADDGDRSFILCEQMEYVRNVTSERIKKVISKNDQGSFIYCEIANANQNFVEEINKATNTKELKIIWSAMQEKAFLSFKINPKAIDETAKEFEQLSFENQQQFLIDVLDKNMLYIPFSEVTDTTYGVSKVDIDLNNKFYSQK